MAIVVVAQLLEKLLATMHICRLESSSDNTGLVDKLPRTIVDCAVLTAGTTDTCRISERTKYQGLGTKRGIGRIDLVMPDGWENINTTTDGASNLKMRVQQ
jgi:hypothetical protein